MKAARVFQETHEIDDVGYRVHVSYRDEERNLRAEWKLTLKEITETEYRELIQSAADELPRRDVPSLGDLMKKTKPDEGAVDKGK